MANIERMNDKQVPNLDKNECRNINCLYSIFFDNQFFDVSEMLNLGRFYTKREAAFI
jgi:hypothetical protein